MSITKNDIHVEDALANRIEQFKNKEDFASSISIYVKQVQDLEDALFQVLLDTTLDLSIGQQLDNLGEIVGEKRLSRTDEAYRQALRVRILINKSSGTIEQILEIAQSFTQSSGVIEIKEFFPASLIIQVVDKLEVDALRLAIALDAARSAGVGLQLLYTLNEASETLTFSSDDTIQSSALLGAADDAQTTGGHLADVITGQG